MVLIHFSKRTLECIFVHIFSKTTKSLNKVSWDLAYTWLFFGVGVAYYLMNPYGYHEPFWTLKSIEEYFYWFLLVSFTFCEIMNYLCHLHLKSFRKKQGDHRLGIPIKHGFGHVSCANYFWEFCAWAIFAIATQCLMAYIFFAFSFFKMNYRAQKKHLRYIAEFKK